MSNIAIVHSSYNPMGGAERVSLGFLKALKKIGYKTTLITFEKTDWKFIKRMAPDYYERPNQEIIYKIPDLPIFGLYLFLFKSYWINYKKLYKKYTQVINTHGDVLIFPSNIVYMHYPVFMFEKEKFSKYNSGFWRLYYLPFKLFRNKLIKELTSKTDYILTNSKFSSERIKEYLGMKSHIIYPPVSIEKYIQKSYEYCHKKEEIVVTVGRYSPEKNYEKIIYIASKLDNITFFIIGSTSTAKSRRYYKYLKKLIKKKKIKNLYILSNIPENKKMEILLKSSLYLHTMPCEPFGIAIVEAMAAGSVPIVPRCGGAWTDIVNKGEYGFGYTEFDQVIDIINKYINMSCSFRKKIINRTKLFSLENFINNIINFYKKHEII